MNVVFDFAQVRSHLGALPVSSVASTGLFIHSRSLWNAMYTTATTYSDWQASPS